MWFCLKLEVSIVTVGQTSTILPFARKAFIFSQLFTEESQWACIGKAIPFCYECLYLVLCHLWVS